MKQIAMLLGAGVIALTLTACGEQSQSPQPMTEDQSTQMPAQEAAPAAAPASAAQEAAPATNDQAGADNSQQE